MHVRAHTRRAPAQVVAIWLQGNILGTLLNYMVTRTHPQARAHTVTRANERKRVNARLLYVGRHGWLGWGKGRDNGRPISFYEPRAPLACPLLVFSASQFFSPDSESPAP